uniref:Uncharacterized protein n=1 Tax=Moniliophthora roreri TaxID=221103 RepID=A0A0W0G4P8_MONRR
MSNGTSSSSSSSTGSYHAHSMPVPPSGTGPHYTDDITYTRPFHPSPFELLFLVNTGGHNDALQNASMGQPHLQFAIDSLIRLRAQHASLNAIIEETNVYAANLTFNATATSKTPSEPTQEFRSIQGHLPTPQPLITTSTTSASVWDNENVSETMEEVERRATVEEVYKFLCALCAGWCTITPETV